MGLVVALLLFALLGGLYLDAQERAILGVVRDEQTGQPISGAEVVMGEKRQATDGEGRFRFLASRGKYTLSVRAEGYLAAQGHVAVEGLFTREFPVEVILRPHALTILVRDGETGQPLPGATVSVGERSVKSGEGGEALFQRLKEGTPIMVVAPGYEPCRGQFQSEETIEISLLPKVTVVKVRDIEGNLVEASVSAGEQRAERDGQGGYTLRRLKEGERISITADGFRPAQAVYDGQSPLEVVLEWSEVAVSVRDRYTGLPIEGARLSHGSIVILTDREGRGLFPGLTVGASLQVTAEGYEGVEVPYQGSDLEITLRPNTLRGVVRDGKSGEPIPGARIYLGGREGHSDQEGSYQLKDVPEGATLTFMAPGYKKVVVVAPPSTSFDPYLEPVEAKVPFEAKGIYITFGLLSDEEKVRALLDLVDRTELNAIVVDVKEDAGRLAYSSQNPLALEIGAQQEGIDIGEVLQLCQERDIYTIARLVIFKDSTLASSKEEWAVKRSDGSLFADNRGSFWVDPFREEVIEYNIAIAQEVAALGFDELQFDYIRFPTDGETEALVYSQSSTAESRYEAIRAFMERLAGALEPLGVFTSADLFGLTAWLDYEADIGQMVENVAPYVDYLSPMLYPSTFTPGLLHWEADKKPTEYPYEVVYESLVRMLERTDKPLRPWLQHFADYKYHLPFGLEHYQAQEKAAYDAGAQGWLFWNAQGVYEEALFQEP